MKDPFEAAVEEQESPPESPLPPEEDAGAGVAAGDGDEDEIDAASHLPAPSSATPPLSSFAAAAAGGGGGGGGGRGREDEDEEEEENMEVELDKIPSGGDPDKLAKMQKVLSKFTEGQMSRYESFRRSGFQKANMRKLLTSITGSQKISVPTTIVVSGIAKLFVGELIETARVVMTSERTAAPSALPY
uniref:TAFII28-like protein domain-containing protein n=1 Tax=Ananas comosus var. bracteatus TaxID=296719 RepID=A0A6V7Q698_ANACO|nr:unnamed protein product [Ananas comosus var. bracteatus]